MPIEYQEPPDGTVSALRMAAATLHHAHGQMIAMLREISDCPLEHQPHPIYAVGLAEMAGDEGLSKAVIIGWRFLAQSEEKRDYAFIVQQDPQGVDYRFAEMNKGPFVEGTLKILSDAKLHAEIDDGTYNLSALKIPALNIFTLWLHAEELEKEVITVVAPAPQYLETWPKLYALEEFQEAVRPHALRKLAAASKSFV